VIIAVGWNIIKELVESLFIWMGDEQLIAKRKKEQEKFMYGRDYPDI
jgi:hypothetical protein